MPSGFEAVEAYLSHIENIRSSNDMPFTVKTEPDFYADQQVPLVEGDMMFGDVKAEPREITNQFCRADPFSFGEDGRLPPVASLTCTQVELSDQQLTGDHSPIQLLDLDRVNNDLPFYPENLDKQVPCYDSQSPCYDNQSQDSIFGTHVHEHDMMSLLDTVQSDIANDCNVLNIPPDPTLWTSEQSLAWATLILQKYNEDTLEAYMFQKPGAELCRLSQSDFLYLSPRCGGILYSQLDIWNNWCTLQVTQEMSMATENAYMSYPEVPIHPAPSVSPAPSSCSVDSLTSSSGSSTGFPANKSKFDFLSSVLDSEPRVERKVRHTEHKQTIHLWQFLKELLVHAHSHGNCIKWLDREKGIFKIEDSSRVATLWGKRKNRPAMNYDKLSRSIRQYYKKGIIKKSEHSKRLVYQFCKPYL